MRGRVRELYEAGLSGRAIAERLGITKSTVAFHMRRFDVPIDLRFARRYDWAEICREYDRGATMSELQKRYGFSRFAWYEAVRKGTIVLRGWVMPLEQLLVIGRRTSRSHLKQRLVREGFKENRCERCGITEWQDQPLTMQLHHINGDGTDNRLQNLEFLCGNCHSQTSTYGGRNGHRKKPAG